jgi:CBS domain containing-hemolysin-like protein
MRDCKYDDEDMTRLLASRHIGALLQLLSKTFLVLAVSVAHSAHASLFKGDTLDAVANGIAWVVLVVVPVVVIVVFWLVHILPEKIAEKKNHPQAKAIQVLCLLSLFFGGLLWPLAWLWAYSKPVLYKMAYGTDRVVHGEEIRALPSNEQTEADELREIRRLRLRIAELENKLADKPVARVGKV